MPTKRQLHQMRESEFEYPPVRRQDDPMYSKKYRPTEVIRKYQTPRAQWYRLEKNRKFLDRIKAAGQCRERNTPKNEGARIFMATEPLYVKARRFERIMGFPLY